MGLFNHNLLDRYDSELVFVFKFEDKRSPLVDVVKGIQLPAIGTGQVYQLPPKIGQYAALLGGVAGAGWQSALGQALPAVDFTYTIWVKTFVGLFLQGALVTSGVSVNRFYSPNLTIMRFKTGPTVFAEASGLSIPAGVFNHFAYVRKAGVMQFYLNGVPVSTTNFFPSVSSFAAGRYQILDGVDVLVPAATYDEAVLWKTALLPVDIAALYNSNAGLAYVVNDLNLKPEFPLEETRGYEVLFTTRETSRTLRRRRNERLQREFELTFESLPTCEFDLIIQKLAPFKSSGAFRWTPPNENQFLFVTLTEDGVSFRRTSSGFIEAKIRLRQVTVQN